MTHYPERRLDPSDENEKTYVVWSRIPARNAIVFVHGYNGTAIPTWTMFESLLPGRPKAKDYDLFFYGYNCLTSNTTAEGRMFCDFLQQICTAPEKFAKAGLPTESGRHDPFQYRKVILVGHSIGAIVCRRALLFARQLGHDWMDRVTLVLFAPAHTGAIISELLKDSESWLKLVISGWRFNSPLVDEIAPGSPMIAMLKQETAAAVQEGANYLKAVKVVIAEVDRVVSNLPLEVDPVPIAFKDTTHSSVCKPRSGFTRPVDEIEQVM